MGRTVIYKVVDTKTNETFSGSCNDVARKIEANAANITRVATNGNLYRGRYKITKDTAEIDDKYTANMTKALKAWGQIHDWYVQYRAEHPKKVGADNV